MSKEQVKQNGKIKENIEIKCKFVSYFDKNKLPRGLKHHEFGENQKINIVGDLNRWFINILDLRKLFETHLENVNPFLEKIDNRLKTRGSLKFVFQHGQRKGTKEPYYTESVVKDLLCLLAYEEGLDEVVREYNTDTFNHFINNLNETIVTDLKDTLGSKDDRIAELQAHNRQLEESVNGLQNDNSNHTRRISELQANESELQSLIRQLNEALNITAQHLGNYEHAVICNVLPNRNFSPNHDSKQHYLLIYEDNGNYKIVRRQLETIGRVLNAPNTNRTEIWRMAVPNSIDLVNKFRRDDYFANPNLFTIGRYNEIYLQNNHNINDVIEYIETTIEERTLDVFNNE